MIRTRYPDISCGTDTYCSVAIVCTSCLTGYQLVGAKCIAAANCYQYAQYLPPTATTTFNSAYCYCLDGYSSSGSTVGACHIRCYYSCKTCTGTAINQCSACYTGYVLNTATNTCDLDNTKALNTYTWKVGDATTSTTAISYTYTYCGSIYSLWGYQDQDLNANTNTNTANKYFSYSFTIANLRYYAIRVKMGLLFVDNYHTGGMIYLKQDGNTTNPIYSWKYNVSGVYGEQYCGTNAMDYLLYVTADIPTRNRTS